MRSRTMDRLICGDVGNGQTELALRAAFKMVQPEAHIEMVLAFRDSLGRPPHGR